MTTEFTHHSALSDAVTKNFEATLQTLTELVAIPSIAWESHDLTQVDRSAEAVAALATKAGFNNVRIERATYTDRRTATEKQACPPLSPSDPPQKATRPSCSTPTTTYSPPATSTCGTPNPSSQPAG